MIDAGPLAIAYEERGSAGGPVALLLHGFPYDPRAFDAVAPMLAAEGLRVITPYLRGFGPTRFRDAHAMRSGEQAALAADALGLLDALSIERALLVGFDWGGRAAGIVAALWPERVRGFLAIGGYLIQDPASALTPLPPAIEQRLWHQYFLASPRGLATLIEDPVPLARHLRSTWSPGVAIDEAAFARSARSFDNPDFARVVHHSYAHRIGAVEGDPAYAALRKRLAGGPIIKVPTIDLRGGKAMLGTAPSPKFEQLVASIVVEGAGHNPAEEAPEAVIAAILRLHHAVG